MISIIVCSRKPDIPDNLKFNVTETIGVDYELIVIDNSENKYSIFSAYNEGVRRAKYSYLCFMHEDILFHTEDWGVKVTEHFKDKTIGLIGVVGGHYMPKCPASWWSAECSSGIVLQGKINNGSYSSELYEWLSHKVPEETSVSVASVDGLWFCVRTELFGKINFDENTYRGFHCYDSDICMQVIEAGYDVHVVFDILIEHLSQGNQDDLFFFERIKWFNKWKGKLPVVKGVCLAETDVDERLNLVKYLNESRDLISELQKIRYSKAYIIGKFILSPLKLIRKKIL